MERSDWQNLENPVPVPEVAPLIDYDNPDTPDTVNYDTIDDGNDNDSDNEGVYHDEEEEEQPVPRQLRQTGGFEMHQPSTNPTRRPRPAMLVGGRRHIPRGSFFRALAARFIQENIMIPNTQSEARNSPHAAHWAEAEEEENNSLEENSVFGQFCELPAGFKAIDTMYVYDLKRKPDRTIERFKARLVAKGHKQRYGIDFIETFAPTAKHASARVLLAHAATTGMTVIQTDVKTAFLALRISPAKILDCMEATNDLDELAINATLILASAGVHRLALPVSRTSTMRASSPADQNFLRHPTFSTWSICSRMSKLVRTSASPYTPT